MSRSAGMSILGLVLAIGAGILAASAIFVMVDIGIRSRYQLSSQVTVNDLVMTFIEDLSSDQAWARTLDSAPNTSLSCLKSDATTPCTSSSGGEFNLLNKDGEVVVNTFEPSAGFTPDGSPCSNYSAENGQTRCAIRAATSWRFICASCANPQIEVTIAISSGVGKTNDVMRTFVRNVAGISPAYVQISGEVNTAGSSLLAMEDVDDKPINGNMLVCSYYYASRTTSISSVTDNHGNVFKRAFPPYDPPVPFYGLIRSEVWYKENLSINASPYVLTTQWGEAFGEKYVVCSEYSGITSEVTVAQVTFTAGGDDVGVFDVLFPPVTSTGRGLIVATIYVPTTDGNVVGEGFVRRDDGNHDKFVFGPGSHQAAARAEFAYFGSQVLFNW